MALSRHWKGADRGPSAPGDHRGSAPRQCQVQPSDFLGRWFSSSLAEGRGSLAQKPGWQACRTDGLLTASPSCPLLRILRSGKSEQQACPHISSRLHSHNLAASLTWTHSHSSSPLTPALQASTPHRPELSAQSWGWD